MAWDDTQISTDNITFTEWNNMVTYIKSVIDSNNSIDAESITITNTTTNNGLFINQDGNGIPLNIDNDGNQNAIYTTSTFGPLFSQTGANGIGLLVSRNLNEVGTYPLVQFKCDHVTNTQAVLELKQDGAGDGITIDQNGDGIALNIDSEATTSAALQIDSTIQDNDSSIKIKHGGANKFRIDRDDTVNDDVTIVLGNYRLWVDSTGDLRIVSGLPSSDTDGVVVGTQS